MSILFYRRPDYIARGSGPLDYASCQKYVERTKHSKHLPPKELSFKQILEHQTLPPVTIGDMMDYMVWVTHDAETLQFYLWYCDYVKRFEALSDYDKALSPKWNFDSTCAPPGGWPFPAADTAFASPPAKTLGSKKRAVSAATEQSSSATTQMSFSQMTEFSLTPMPEINEFPLPPTVSAPGHLEYIPLQNYSTRETSRPSFTESGISWQPAFHTVTEMINTQANAQVGLKWQGFSIQPFRAETMRITSHYLAPASPRHLPLSHATLASVLHALQHTTHPSAFPPAIDLIFTHLYHCAHPNFVRWSICNGNAPRVFFIRTMGILHTILGFVIATLLSMSKASRWWRLLAAPVLFIGITTLVAAYKGLCVILQHEHKRTLRSWEDPTALSHTFSNEETEAGKPRTSDSTQPSSRGQFDPFGNPNDSGSFTWSQRYKRKSLARKIFDETVVIQDQAVRILQDTIVKQAQLLAAIITGIVTVVFVALPLGNLY